MAADANLECERLWKLHDELADAVAERRERAGIELVVNAGLLAAAVAVTLDPPVTQLARNQTGVGLFVTFLIVLSLLAVLLSYLGLSPGLPWERAPGPELIGWLIGLTIGASVRGERARRLRRLYDESPLSYRRVRSATQTSASPSVAVRTLARAIDADVISGRIEVLAEQLHQLRRWRRLVAVLTLLTFATVAVGVGGLLATSAGVTARDFTAGLAVVGVVYLVLALGLRLGKDAAKPEVPQPVRLASAVAPGATVATAIATTALLGLVTLQSWAEFGQVLLLATVATGFGTYTFARRGGHVRALGFAALAAILTVDLALAVAEFAGWH